MKIASVISNAEFNDMEYLNTKEKLEEAGFEVVTFSKEGGFCQGSHGETVEDSISFDDIEREEFDMLLLIGGAGCMDNVGDEVLTDLMEYFIEEKSFGAICLAPRIPLYEGLLVGRNVTGWDDDREFDQYVMRGEAQYIHEDVVIDRNVVTANGPMAAYEMGEALVFVLSNR